MKQEVDLPTRYIITHVILMKQKVYLPTKYRITHVILMKQEGDLQSTSCFIRITCVIAISSR
jgi:hypothetical protein